jgi:hypothetical protein
MPPVTRSQTAAAARAAAAAAAAASAARPVSSSSSSSSSPRAASRAASSAASRRPLRIDTIAMARDSARQAFLDNRAARNGLQNALVQNIARLARINVPRNSRRNANTRAIATLESNIRSLYNVNSELLQYFDVNQLLYFGRTSLYENYYYRRLELTYGIPIIDKFSDLCEEIITIRTSGSSPDIITQQYRDMFAYLSQLLSELTIDMTSIKNKTRVKQTIVNEILFYVANEKTMITNLITHLTSIRSSITTASVRADLNQLVGDLNSRLTSLNTITRNVLVSHFSKPEFEIVRHRVLTVLKCIKTIIYTFMVLLAYLLINVATTNSDQIFNNTMTNMFEAISAFTYIININDTTATNYATTLDTAIAVQNSIYHNLITLITPFIQTRMNILGHVTLPREIQRNIRVERQPIRAQATIARIAENARIAAERLAAARIATRARIAENQRIAAARAARDAARDAARAARDASRAARDASRAAPRGVSIRASSQVPAGPSVSVLPDLTSMMSVDSAADATFNNQFYNDTNDQYKRSRSLMTLLKPKYTEYSKTFTLDTDRKHIGAILNTKYKTYFNTDDRVTGRATNIQTIKHVVGNSIASLFGRYIKFNEDIKFNDLSKYFVCNYTLVPNAAAGGQRYTLDRQSGIDAGGLRRDFINSLINELFEKKIFITRDGTQKYFLNPDFKFTDEFIFIIRSIVSDQTWVPDINVEMPRFYKFIGVLLTFLLVNNCGITHNLSSYLIANFYTPNSSTFNEIDYVYFMLQDFPAYATSILNLLKDPDNIEYVYIGVNDYYKLTDTADEDLTSDNIEEFLKNVSKFMMTKTMLRKDLEITSSGSTYDRYITHATNIHKWFIEGIPREIKNELQRVNFTLKSTTSFLVAPSMSQEIVNSLIANFTSTMNSRIQSMNATNKAIHTQFKTLFINYVLKQKPGQTEDEFFKFMTSLLLYWSGSAFYKDNERYRIDINNALSNNHLPQSHTCFFAIDIPNYRGATPDDIGNRLYEKIKMAVTNVEQGIGLAGGCGSMLLRHSR